MTKAVSSLEAKQTFEDFAATEGQSYRLHTTKYKGVKLLGKGNAGAVFLAEHLSLGKRVAIKFLNHNLTSDTRAVTRFQTEARELSNLSHPNLVEVFDLDTSTEGTPYMVMEYAEGTDLKTLLSQSGTLEVEKLLEIVLQLCDALIVTHDAKIVHRDLKPANVILSDSKNSSALVKLVDFGIVKPSLECGELQRLTQSGELLGSPSYMSPEQIRGGEIDARSDIYSLGCVMYEALTGKVPLRGNSIMETLSLHMEKEPEPMIKIKPELKSWRDLAAIVENCLDKDLDRRPSSAAKLKQDLLKVLDSRRNRADRLKQIAFVGAVATITLGLVWLAPTRIELQKNNKPTASASNDLRLTEQPNNSLRAYITELARGELIFYTGRTEDCTKIYSEILEKSLKNNDPQKIQLALAVYLIEQHESSPRDLKAASAMYKKFKKQIESIMASGSSDVDSLFAAYLLYCYAETINATVQDLDSDVSATDTDGMNSSELISQAIARYSDALYLAKRRRDIDGDGIVGGAYMGLGVMHVYQKRLKAARQDYKQAFDWLEKAQGLRAEKTTRTTELLVNTSVLQSKKDREANATNKERIGYLKSASAALDKVIKAHNEDDEVFATLVALRAKLDGEMYQ